MAAEALDALERGLAAALQEAHAAHGDTLVRMDAARRALDALLADERDETAQYVAATRHDLRALRDAVQREMAAARRDVDAMVRSAVQRQQVVRAATATTTISALNTTSSPGRLAVPATTALDHGAPPLAWALPLVMTLIVGVAALWVTIAVARAKRAAATAARRQRVLYSEQLQSDGVVGSTNQRQGKPRQATASAKPKNESNSPRSPSSFDRRPTLHRRLRPGWSPAASTASTVSPPETPTSVFARHSAFESVQPPPF